jgi:hypothetical protein
MSTPIETNTEELQTILQTVNNLPNPGGSGSSDVFVVHVTLDENHENAVSVDKTFEETAEAINSGKACFAVVGESMVIPMWYSQPYDEEIVFRVSRGSSIDRFYFYGDGSFEYYTSYEEPYYLVIQELSDNGEVVSGVITDENELTQCYKGLDGAGVVLIVNVLDANGVSTSYQLPLNLAFVSYPNDNYNYFARTFVKEGHIDISIYEEYENDEITEIRWEASFAKTT